MALNANHRIRGTMKLEYDATPRDNDLYEASTKDYVDASNFRFRGYPGESMEKPRELPQRPEDLAKIPQKNYHLPNYLDTKKPKIYEDVHAFQYGSEHLPLNKQMTRPVRDPFNEKTAAELAKNRQEQVEADFEIQAFKAEKQMKTDERENEKKKDLEQLLNYHPWGKPGAGAPTAQERGEAHKKHKITDEALYNSPREPVAGQRQIMEEYGDFNGRFGRPGHGAPLMDESTGKMKTEIKGAADIRFLDTKGGRKVYETELRYQKPGLDKHSYFQELEKQVQLKPHEKKGNSTDARLENLRQELQTMVQNDPFGKPGAGAPNKSTSGNVLNAKKTTLSKDGYEQRRIDHKGFVGTNHTENVLDEEYGVFDPWGKGAVQPNRNKFGEPLRHKNADTKQGVFTQDKSNYEVSLNTISKAGGGGAPVHAQDGQVQARFPATLKRNEIGDSSVREDHPRQEPAVMPDDPELQIYDPFGKVGAGAPLRDAGGKVVSHVYGKIQSNGVGQPVSSASAKQKKFQAQTYLHELRREMDEQKVNKELDRNMGRVEDGGLTEVLRKGQVGKPRRDPVTGELLRQDLNMSDVTIQRTDTRKLKSKDSMNYLTDLERAALERKRKSELDKLQDRQQSKHHAAQMDDFWGRPGGGAPRATGTKNSNLDMIINSPRTMSPVYNQVRVTEETRRSKEADQKHYVRPTKQGSSSNNYEMTKPLKREAKTNYNLLTPYASEPGEVF